MSKITFILLILSNICVCSNNRGGLIINGKKAKSGTFPHSAFLMFKCNDMFYLCGGSIINQRMILTSGHCMYGCKFNQIAVKVGNVDLEVGHMFACQNYIIHKKCKGISERFENGYDIGIVLVREQINFGPTLKRVILTKHPPETEFGYVSGWGMTKENEEFHDKNLRYTKQRILDMQTCKYMLDRMFEGTMCARTPRGSKLKGYPAQGDSGGALVVKKTIQIGIVSYRETTNADKTLVVYTYIPYYFDWIERTIRQLYCG